MKNIIKHINELRHVGTGLFYESWPEMGYDDAEIIVPALFSILIIKGIGITAGLN